jgi:hypothetical protein
MLNSSVSLKTKFLSQMFLILIIVALISGGLQLYLMKERITEDMEHEANMMSRSIQQGIKETDMASKAIERQIDIKMISISKHIADRLEGKKLEEITDEQLLKIRDEFGLAGLTIFARNEARDDIVGVRATEPEEIGFSFKGFGYLHLHESLLKGEEPNMPGAYTDKNILVLETAQSGSHKDKPVFFKYAYYRAPGTDYIIDPYIEANEVYQFTQEVGPDAWIAEVKKNNPFVEEIAVLNPLVFKDPALETQLYPPKKKVIHGTYELQHERDTDILIQMIEEPANKSYIQKINGKRFYKVFLPIGKEQTVFVALDYEKMSAPLYRFATVLIVSGLLALMLLFMFTARFFGRIYRHIQQIIRQIKLLESGDLTAKSHIKDKGELADLSNTANKMVDSLNQLLKDTQEQAANVQRSAVLLQAEASDSVEKVFAMSMEKTSYSRESLEEINYFIDQVKEQLVNRQHEPKVKEILHQIEKIRQYAGQHTNNTTEITLSLSDVIKSLHGQSSELSDISNNLLRQMAKFKL